MIKTYWRTLVVALLFLWSCQSPNSKYELKTGESNGYSYEYVTNDPLKVRIYTLKNGLKVYLSQYKAEPRIQTQIAVRAGGKNDPATNTGLAHYLEHIMFKGTADFGTLDWQKESVYLDSIEHMFTHYGTLKDSTERVQYYKLIDQVSNEASRFAIANEYDKMVSELGARGTNAYTSQDRTVYINDIPANQLENWLQLEGNRFQKIVPRLFHTELEAVYEEKNRTLDNDYWKTFETLYSSMFTKHPYGTQTVIGTIDHLKNPSITEIKNYFNTYYRPNNVAICLSGDLDYDKTIALIEKNFGNWKPNGALPTWNKVEEPAIATPVIKEVYGPDAEWINIGFRFNGRNSEDYKLLTLTDMILSNSQAGLIDINLKQQQKVIEPSSYVDQLGDYSLHTFSGRPREGQSLEDVKTG
jgi:predicted Zn-dependent peptidase